MKKYAWIPLIVLAFILMGALNPSPKHNNSDDDIITSTRNISDFTKLKFEGVYNVYLSQGTNASVKIEAPEDIQDLIQCKNKGDKLTIKMQDNAAKKGDNISIYVTVKDLTELEGNFVGTLNFKDIIKTDIFTLNITGVGKNIIRINCNQFNATISSVGEVVLEGKCKSANIQHSGVGSLKAFNFITDYLSTSHTGIGSVEVFANKELDVNCSGIGSVYYKGNPSQKSINVTGLGKVRSK